MERIRRESRLENYVLSTITLGEFLGTLSVEEFDVLWDRTDPELTMKQIGERNGMSVNQVNNIMLSLMRKANAFLRE